MSAFFSFLKNREFYIGVLKYALAINMIGYGLWKMKGYQGGFLSPASAWQLPLEALDGSQLVWYFVGYSRWFQFLLGLFEFVPGCLLLFRRTQLLGAVLMLPMTVGVFLVNYALDLWTYTKIASLVQLLVNVLIIALHRERLSGIIKLLIRTINKRKYGWVESAINIGIILFMSRKLLSPLYNGNEAYTRPFCGDCFNHHPNEWVLVKESTHDSIYQPRNLRCYFTPRGAYAEINDNNNSADYLIYEIDRDKSELKIEKGYYYPEEKFLLPSKEDTGLYSHFAYTFVGDTLMELKGGDGHTWVFRRRIINEGRF